MKQWKSLLFIGILTTLPGCSVSDMFFGIFGDHYTGGGTTEFEKRWDYDRQVELANGRDPHFATR